MRQDNNGVLIQLPAVNGVAATLNGSMIFGIGTQSNNGLGSAKVFTVDSFDNFTTNFNQQAMTKSFIDSGSNGFFFPDSSIPACLSTSNAPGFFCPASAMNLSAQTVGTNSDQSTVNFSVANANTLFQANFNDAAFSQLGGPSFTSGCGGPCGFDWGLPFFYGRNASPRSAGRRCRQGRRQHLGGRIEIADFGLQTAELAAWPSILQSAIFNFLRAHLMHSFRLSSMGRNWKTKLIHSDAKVPEGFRSLSPGVHRASTVLFPDAASVNDTWDQYEVGYTYGLYGTPTTLELATRVCELERGFRTLITPGGQGAISLINLTFLKAGDHVLLPESVYTPSRKFAGQVLKRFGVEVEFYSPDAGAEIAKQFRANTRLVWCESPGSITMEVQDVPAIAEAAHRASALVAMDNTWSAGVYFDAFAHGIDISMQALTKYVAGHSDVLLGSITVRDKEAWRRLGSTHQLVGSPASPDDCSLALRGMKTLAVRLKAIEEAGLALARWLQERPEIERVLHPALPTCPGHEFFKRDFTGSAGLFSIVFHPRYSKEQVFRFVDRLELFEIGYSWAGVTSLAVAYDFHGTRGRPEYGHRIVRLNIGLEDVGDLRADLEQALRSL